MFALGNEQYVNEHRERAQKHGHRKASIEERKAKNIKAQTTKTTKKFTAMKRSVLVIALGAVALLGTVGEAIAQRVSTKTYFAGDRITGVSASSAFDVVLVKSIQTKAVVEINSEFESYVSISRNGEGIVTVGMRDMGQKLWREFNRLDDDERRMRLTLYLPSVNTIRLSGASELGSRDPFTGENVDIQLSGASEIEGELNISAARVKLQCSGASEASLVLPATRDLVVVASGASEVDIVARGLTYSKLGASGASEIEIEGNGERGDWTASGASEISGKEFAMKELSAVASGASSVKVNVSGTLSAKASGASSVRYVGVPATLDVPSSSVRPL